MTGDKYVVTVKVERVVREQAAQLGLPTSERKVDTVASVIVTADDLVGAIRKAKAHLDAEGQDLAAIPLAA